MKKAKSGLKKPSAGKKHAGLRAYLDLYVTKWVTQRKVKELKKQRTQVV